MNERNQFPSGALKTLLLKPTGDPSVQPARRKKKKGYPHKALCMSVYQLCLKSLKIGNKPDVFQQCISTEAPLRIPPQSQLKSFPDSFTGLINILTDIIWRFTGDFMAPDLVCRVVRYFQVVLLYASTYVLVSLSIDRYHAIVHPMKFLQGEKQAKVLIGIAWSLSFLFSIPTLIIFGKRTLSNGEVQCWALWPDDSYWTPYMTIVAFLVYFIPLTIISVIYGLVIRTIWIKSKAHETVISNCSDGKLCSSYNRGLISKAKIKAIKYSIVIILAFICCWSPYFLFDMLDNFNLLPDTKERFYASVIIQNLPALNSAINPLIYCIFSSSVCFPCKEQRSQDSRMTFRERSERQEMQILSKPEFI
ncbi:hypothetical protein STEG23_025550 [Scotinomys teguina]